MNELVVSGTQCNQWLIQNFPDGDAISGFETKPIIWNDFGRKLHENKKKLDGVGGRVSLVPSLDPPMTLNINFFQGQTQDRESTRALNYDYFSIHFKFTLFKLSYIG